MYLTALFSLFSLNYSRGKEMVAGQFVLKLIAGPKTAKLLFAMKLTTVFLFVACLSAAASGNSQTVTLNMKNVPVQQVFKEVSRQSGVSIIYNEALLEGLRPVTIRVNNATVQEALNRCFEAQPLTYTVENNAIIIKPRVVVTRSATKSSEDVSPAIDIMGRVTDETGLPLNGASIKVKGTNIGASADAGGMFKLKGVANNAELVFSYVGYETRTLTLAAFTAVNFSVALKKSDNPLDEVQIIAYGEKSKRLQTGNVTTIKAEAIEKQPVGNPLLALQGKTPGLFLTQTSGLSGSGVTVRIQGQNSITYGNDPLYVVDGVPYPSQFIGGLSDVLGTSNYSPGSAVSSLSGMGKGNPLSFINPADIESIEILKDADATSIYGARAANGAILITTKKGKARQTLVSVNLQHGWGEVPEKIAMLNSQQYMQLRHDALANDGYTLNTLPFPYNLDELKYFVMPDLLGLWDTTRYTNWQKELIGGKAKYTDVQASVSGGSENTQVFLSAGYHKETTVFPGDFADEKGTVHLNFNHLTSNRKFRAQFSGVYTMGSNKLPNYDLTAQAFQLVPNAPALYNPDGSLNWQPYELNGMTYYAWDNPLASYVENKYNNKTNNLVANATLSYQILKGLQLSSSFGYNELSSDELVKYPLSSVKPDERVNTERLSVFGNSVQRSWIIEPQLNYQSDIWKGKLEAVAGLSYQRSRKSWYKLNARNFSSDLLMEDLKSAGQLSVDQTFDAKYMYNGTFARVNYNVQDKYLLNLSARRDGSTRFGSNNLFHTFWSVGGAWIFSKESFIEKNLPFLSYGKIRASYGTTGSDQIDDYLFLDIYTSVYSILPYNGATGLMPTSFPNPNLQWEEVKKMQFGLDLGFFNERILLNAGVFRNRSSNQLLSYPLPTLTGIGTIKTNFDAVVQNSGMELMLTTVNIKKTNFTWRTNFNITSNKNKLVSFPDIETSSYSQTLIVGEPINIQRVYHYLGVNPATGLPEVEDASGKPTSMPNFLSDQLWWVDQTPKFYGGLGNTITYKGFELDFTFHFVKQLGRDYYYGNAVGDFYNQPAWILDYWRKPGDITDHQKPRTMISPDGSTINSLITGCDEAYRDASFIRLKNVSFSWNVPEAWVQKIKMKQCRLYTQGQNLYTFTKYKGLDPETKSSTSLPVLRVITFGIQVGL